MTKQTIVNASQFSEPESIPSIFSTVGEQLQTARKSSAVDLFFRKKFLELFERLEEGCIHVIDPSGTTYVGDLNAELQCTLVTVSLYTSPSPRDLSTSRMPSSA